MPELEQEAASVIVTRYLSGESCNKSDIERSVTGFPEKFTDYVKDYYGNYNNFLTNILPGDTRTRKCKKCSGLIQVSGKDTRSIYCRECKQTISREIIANRIESGDQITFRSMMRIPDLKWIVTQCQSIWGLGYREFVKSEFNVDLPTNNRTETSKSQTRTLVIKRSRAKKRMTTIRSVADRNRIVERNLPLVTYWVDRFTKNRPLRCLGREDLIQEGVFGLVRAAELFDPSRGFKFSTYASWWIKQTIQRAWISSNFPVKFPARYNVTEDPENMSTVSYLSSTDSFSEDGKYSSSGKASASDSAPDQGFDLVECLEVLRGAGLDDRELDIFFKHAVERETLDSIGRKYSLSRERIRQLYATAREKLREVYTSDKGFSAL
jgi:RNA polymerase sigma factor (sigma-70 family)